MSRSVLTSLALLLSTIALPAFGQNGRQGSTTSRDQVYEFDDDPLDAVGLNDRGARVRSRRTTGRVTLIRPRTHFIGELTRSVENL